MRNYCGIGLRPVMNSAIGFAYALLAIIGHSVEAQTLPRWVDSVEIVRTTPGGIGSVTLSGIWHDTCVPDAISHRLGEDRLSLTVTSPSLGVGCGDALTPWTLTEEFGPWDAPSFSVYGTAVLVNPHDRNERRIWSGPDLLVRRFPPQPQGEFHGLGRAIGSPYVSEAFETSESGRVVVGHDELMEGAAGFITHEATVWTPETRMFPIGFLPGGIPGGSTSRGVSGNGNTVVGVSDSARGSLAFRWTLGRGMEPLPRLLAETHSEANAANWSGSVIVGEESHLAADPSRSQRNAFRWTREGGMKHLGQLHPGGNAWATDVSADGNIVVGSATLSPFIEIANPDLSEPFIWTEETGMLGLGHLPTPFGHPLPFRHETTGDAISADGQFVVGTSRAFSPFDDKVRDWIRGFIWNKETGMRDIGQLPDVDTLAVRALDVNTDGSIVVGMTTIQPPDGSADRLIDVPFVWTRGDGMRTLRDILLEAGLESAIAGWRLGSVSAISADGTTIVGTGINPQGDQEAWRVVIERPPIAAPPVALSDLNGDGAVDASDAALIFANWGTVGPAGDINNDGAVDAGDAGIAFAEWTGDARPRVSFSAVPEPAVSLAALVTLTVLLRRMRR